ncbi:MAG: acyl-CoA synthetase [Acidimicrobiales bacterium]|jgi:acyl-CoA synthetase (AMP-forming)/AMP-acid ligase II|nr:acyl-CoA synthetase [Acidimicrobiales bacterium]
MSFNLSELFERVADAVPDREALVTPSRRLTYRQLDERANRLAHHLAGVGVRPDDRVGLQLVNGTEYLEGMLALCKLRAVAVNVNHRYVERELVHLYDDADLVGLVVHRSFLPRVEAVLPSVPRLRHLLVVEDGSDAALPPDAVRYEEALAAASPDRDFTGRTSDDVYCAYTGGTTGLPKGVLWRHEDIFFAAMGGGDATQMEGPISDPDELPGRIPESPIGMILTPPLMHVSAQWGAFQGLFGGGKVVLPSPGPFDPDEVLRLIGEEQVAICTIVGDAMARPLLDTFAAQPDAYDLSTLFVLASGGAVFAPATKAQAARLLPNVIVLDGFGSSETGVTGSAAQFPGAEVGARTAFAMNSQTTVLDDDMRPVPPGSGRVGRLARQGHVPLGYHKDPEKTRARFVEVDGVRWVLPGDMATIEADGTIVLLGRGSLSINTGGEKVFPEEVEAVVKGHPAVYDAVVVGIPDDRWGETVCALVQLRPGAILDLEELQVHCREALAAYKVPRSVQFVDAVVRGPNAKADYRWAKEYAVAHAAR